MLPPRLHRPHQPRQPPTATRNVRRPRTTAPPHRPAVPDDHRQRRRLPVPTRRTPAHIRPSDGTPDDDLPNPHLGTSPHHCGRGCTATPDHPRRHLPRNFLAAGPLPPTSPTSSTTTSKPTPATSCPTSVTSGRRPDHLDDAALRARPSPPAARITFVVFTKAPGDDDVTTWLWQMVRRLHPRDSPVEPRKPAPLRHFHVSSKDKHHTRRTPDPVRNHPRIRRAGGSRDHRRTTPRQGYVTGHVDGQASLLANMLALRFGTLNTPHATASLMPPRSRSRCGVPDSFRAQIPSTTSSAIDINGLACSPVIRSGEHATIAQDRQGPNAIHVRSESASETGPAV